MLVGGILGAVVLAGLAVAVLTHRRSLDDEHSVQGYHRQLHTLESISAHPVAGPVAVDGGVAGAGGEAGATGAAGSDGAGGASAAVKPIYPESAVRLAATTTPRTPEQPPAAIPPPVVPAKADGSAASINSTSSTKVTFDDATPASPAASTSGLFRRQDRAMNAMNRRPRRLAAPALAVASVTVLIVVLLLAGSHKVPPPTAPGSGHTHGQGHRQATSTSRGGSKKKKNTQATTTTTLPIVSLPTATSTHAANYQVANSAFTLVVGATTAPCWINVTNPSSNATIFTGVLAAGQQQSLPVTGPVSLEVGAPSVFAGTINGKAFVLPYGYQTPFTLNFVPVGTPST